MFKGAGGSLQVHDFNPGEENGLFWTVPIADDNLDLEVDLDDGAASLMLSNFDIDDYGDVGNAISGGKEIATARLRVDLEWHGATKPFAFNNASLPTPVRVKGVATGATMRWSAVEGGSTISGAANTADFAILVKERNGVFFRQKGDEQ